MHTSQPHAVQSIADNTIKLPVSSIQPARVIVEPQPSALGGGSSAVEDGSLAKSFGYSSRRAHIDKRISPCRPLRRVCTGDSAKHQRAAVFGTPRQSSGTAEMYARHKKPRSANGAPQQTVGVLQN